LIEKKNRLEQFFPLDQRKKWKQKKHGVKDDHGCSCVYDE
jgi:hypothetical protein